jgi:DNA-binding transcriptional MocR family regulator
MTQAAISRETTSPPLFEQVADRIREMIDAGTLRAGDRVPSVRRLREQFRVSISTVLEAYRLLEDRGLIVAKPQSGHYVRSRPREPLAEPGRSRPVRRAKRIEEPLSMCIVSTLGDPTKVALGPAVPAHELLPSQALNRALGRVLRRAPLRCHQYDVPPGAIELRQQIARRMIDAGCSVSADDIVITNGATESVYLAIQSSTRPGDTVAVESPTYYGLLETLHALHLPVLPIASETRKGICLDALEEALKGGRVKAVVTIANFSNPTGHCMSDKRKRALVQLCAKHQVALIEDDIYGDLPHEGARPTAMKCFDADGGVLYCGSFSKTLTPGFRIGWCIPGRWQAEFERRKQMLNHMTPTATQLAIAEYLAGGGYDRHLRRMRRAYREQTLRMIDAVARHFPRGTKVTQPEGGHVLWIELDPRVDAMKLFEDAGRAGVSIAPGPVFAVHGEYRNCIRLNCGLPWSPRIDNAVQTLGRLVAEQMG